eukprot:292405-Pleurochrysis_carterae.AAC.1
MRMCVRACIRACVRACLHIDASAPGGSRAPSAHSTPACERSLRSVWRSLGKGVSCSRLVSSRATHSQAQGARPCFNYLKSAVCEAVMHACAAPNEAA